MHVSTFEHPTIGSDDRLFVHASASGLLVAIADGAGGMPGATAAAEAFISLVRTRVSTLVAASAAELVPFFALADDIVVRTAAAGETTAVLVCIDGAGIVGASAGNSGALFVDVGRAELLTEDQPRKRLGSGRAAATSFARAREAGVLVIATDGLFDFAPIADVAALCRSSSDDLAAMLAASVRLPSGRYPDDIAIAVILL